VELLITIFITQIQANCPFFDTGQFFAQKRKITFLVSVNRIFQYKK